MSEVWTWRKATMPASRARTINARPPLQVEELEGRVVPAFPPVITLNNLGAQGFTARGFEDSTFAGASVSSAGDVNGDGFDDLLIGAGTTFNTPGADLGAAYVVFGGTGLAGGSLTLNNFGAQGFTLNGFEELAGVGSRVSGAGDVNGDGFDDLIIGALSTNGGGTNRGAAYVVFGGSGLAGANLTLNNLGTQGFTLNGFENNAVVGNSVSGAGDVNGDGFDDLIIGAYGTDAGGTNRGAAYVVFGGMNLAGGSLALDNLGAQGFTLNGFENNAVAGSSVSGAGDVNDDGFDDLIVGAGITFDTPGADLGAVYVVFGGTNLAGANLSLNTLGAQGFTLNGFESNAGVGSRVSGAGDVNGDGFDDLILGALGTDAGGFNRGAAYVVFGGSGLAGASLTLNNFGVQGFTLNGFENNAVAGSSVSGVGDVNGDGFDDLLVGASGTDLGGAERGAAYVVFGGSSLAGANLALDNLGAQGVTLTGFENGAQAGNSVSGAGDVNGDGIDDLVVGAYRTDEGGTDRGAAYVILGQDDLAPTAAISSAPDVTDGSAATSYPFTVSFLDNGNINTALLGNTDVRVEGPGGFDMAASLVSIQAPGAGRPLLATYQLMPPGGTWDLEDNGTYSIRLQPNEVSDVAGLFAAPGLLATFLVTRSPTVLPPVVLPVRHTSTVRVKRVGERTRVTVLVDGLVRRRFFPFGGYKGQVQVRKLDLNGDGLLDVIARARINGRKESRPFLTV